MINASLEKQIEFLRSRGAMAQPHSFSNLMQHLIGTRAILLSWQASPALCTAGLFHSVYGTESFQIASADFAEREVIREIIGEKCEEIVYYFSVMTRESFEANLTLESEFNRRIHKRTSLEWIEISASMFHNLCNLSAANWLEQWERLPSAYRELGQERYRVMLKFVMPEAAEALNAAYNFGEPLPVTVAEAASLGNARSI